MTTEIRRFPRVRCRLEGEMDVEVSGSTPGAESQTLLVTVLSLTCEGVGLRIQSPRPQRLARDVPVALRFRVGETAMELPGAVAWHHERRDPQCPFDVGIRLRMEGTGSGSTLAYAQWIVGLVGRSMNREMELGVVLLQIAHLSLETLLLALARRRETWRPVGEVLLEMNAITSYELRVAQNCRLPCADESVPASLLEWQRSLESSPRARRG